MATQHPWEEAPPPAEVHRPLPAPVVYALAVWIGVAGPWLRARILPASDPQQVAMVGLVATLGMLALPRRAWYLRLGVAALTMWVLYPYQGVVITLWIGVGLLLGAWVARDRPPLPFLPSPGEGTTAPVVVLTGVAAWQGAREGANYQPFIPYALAMVMPLFTRIGNGRLERVAKRFGHWVAEIVSPILFTILGLFLVLLPWSVQRLLRVDPLHAPRGWSGRDRRPLQPAQPWAMDPASAPPPWSMRVRYPVAFTATALLVLAIVVRPELSLPEDEPSTAERLGLNENVSQDSWYPQYQEDITWALDEKVAFRPFEIHRLWDVETRTVNIHDGRRDSWTPPSCDCERLTVWLYGGGGAFGFEQRDDHTIASELAREAAANGITMDVRNLGIPGQLHFRTSLRFAMDLTTEDRPDLVLFYEGAEEIESATTIDEKGLGDIKAPYEVMNESTWDEIHESPLPLPFHPDSAESLGWPTVGEYPRGEVGLLANRRYERYLQLSDDTGAEADIPVRYFWQPSAYTRTEIEAKALEGREDRAEQRQAWADASARLDDRVIDLTDALAGVRQPVYNDPVHPNERGARLIARAMFDELRPQLEQLYEAKQESAS